MKQVTIKYSLSGLNSPRLILNAIIDRVEDTEHCGIVEISPEVNFGDVESWIRNGLVYDVDFYGMSQHCLKTGIETQVLKVMVKVT